MSDTESFIDEVTEEVRRDQLFGYIKRYGWIAAVAVVGLVGGAAWNEYSKVRSNDAAQLKGDAIYAALASDDSAERVAALSSLPMSPVVSLLLAAEQQQSGDAAAAAVTLDALAADAASQQLYREIAQFKSVLVQSEVLTADARIAALEPLAQPGRPFRLLALEQIAVAELEAGDKDAAIATLQQIAEDAGVTQGLRGRVTGLMVALGEDPEVIVPAETAQ